MLKHCIFFIFAVCHVPLLWAMESDYQLLDENMDTVMSQEKETVLLFHFAPLSDLISILEKGIPFSEFTTRLFTYIEAKEMRLSNDFGLWSFKKNLKSYAVAILVDPQKTHVYNYFFRQQRKFNEYEKSKQLLSKYIETCEENKKLIKEIKYGKIKEFAGVLTDPHTGVLHITYSPLNAQKEEAAYWSEVYVPGEIEASDFICQCKIAQIKKC